MLLHCPLSGSMGREQGCSRIRGSIRMRETRIARKMRRRAHTLWVTLAHKRRTRQIGPDGPQEGLIGHRGLGSAALGVQGHHLRAHLLGIERRAGECQHATDPLQAIAFTGPGGTLSAHRADLLRPKGRPTSRSRCRISFSITNSPIRRVAALSLACRGSLWRSLSPASIPARAFSRHASRR